MQPKRTTSSCGTCGSPFELKRSWVPRQFCSRRCSSVAREATRAALRAVKRCRMCDALIVGGRQRRDRAFCSRRCSAARQTRRPETPARRKQSALMCRLVARCLVHLGLSKRARVTTILGYSRQELTVHLESLWQPGMSWANYGRGGWVVDHIRPIISFSLDTPPSVVCALTNLQPLWERDNMRKGARLEAV